MKIVKDKIKELEQIVITNLAKEYIPNIVIEYDLDSSKALGTTSYSDFSSSGIIIIRLNQKLIDELQEIYVNEVVVHEYAHAVVRMIYPNLQNNGKWVKAHGKEFKKVCRMFGIEGRATTSIASHLKYGKSKTLKKFYYKCNCLAYKELSTIRHNKIIKGLAKYSCNICQEELKYYSKVD